MDVLSRLQLQTGETNDFVLIDCMETAKSAIMSRRFPYSKWPVELEQRYVDLQYRIALDLYNKAGAEGEIAHSENGVSRSYESSWISKQLLQEVIPFAAPLR